MSMSIIKSIDEPHYSLSNISEVKIKELSTLDFINNHENIIFAGSSGVAKTHLALALGYLAIKNRVKTKFISANELIYKLSCVSDLKRYFKKVLCGLLIIDEPRYTRLSDKEANLF